MTSPLPSAIDAYFTGKNTRDFALAASGFAPSAVVKDEHYDHVGPDAIAAWIADSTARYDDKVTIQSASTDADGVAVLGEVAGTFPGSPIVLRFRFALDNGQITKLTIAP